MDANDPIPSEEIVLQKLKLALRGSLDRKVAESLVAGEGHDLKVFMDCATDEIIWTLRCFVWSDEPKVFRAGGYPTTWWDAVKVRFAPSWFLSRWPANYTEVMLEVANVYPHLKLSLPGEQSVAVLHRTFRENRRSEP